MFVHPHTCLPRGAHLSGYCVLFHCLLFLYYAVYITALLCNFIMLLGPTVEACTSRALPDYKSAILLPPKSQSHTKVPFAGPAVTIMSFNVEGLSAANEQLIADLRHRLQCAVVCVQETHRGPDAIRPSIPGMDLAIERPHSQYGSAIFVTSGTIVNTTSLTDIRITLKSEYVTIHRVNRWNSLKVNLGNSVMLLDSRNSTSKGS